MSGTIKKAMIFFIVASVLSGCSLPRQEKTLATPTIEVPPSATPNLDMTVQAAVKSTELAKNGMQATINSSVATTLTAVPPAAVPVLPTPTPINATYVTEEEVAAMVEKEVNEALAASSACASASTAAAADDTITSEELAELEAAVLASEQAIYEATALAEQYLALYTELGEETIALLQQVETELATMSTSTAQIAATLEEINISLQQGLALAEETITKLETQASEIQTQVTEIQTAASGWKDKVSAELENRANLAAGLQADQIATDKAGTLQQLSQYMGQMKASLADGKLSLDELNSVVKLGANASASLRQFGDAGTSLADKITGLNRNLARGELPQVTAGLADLDKNFASLGASLRDKPSPSLPKLPTRK